MTDLDFDEIDRAVNSLNNTAPVVNNDNPESIEQPVVNPANTTPAPAARRSSGQFMDVVHPSSDMRRTPLMMPERESRPNISPSPQPDAPNLSETTVSTPEPEQDVPTLPDPIDFTKTNEDADIDQISDEITNELSGKSGDLPDSPFLSDAKVEKRPLGAFSTESTVETFEQPESEPSTEPISSDTKDNSPLPDELQEDLLKVESDNSVASESTESIEKIDENDGGAPSQNTEPVSKPELEPEKPTVATPVSIVQQYKEQPSTGEQNSGAIYDTNSYHKGLVIPVKKKSGWLWVLWIVLLIALGAGAGAAIYFVVIPML